MEVGQRYRVTWKHPKARRRRMAEGTFIGWRNDRYAIQTRRGVILVNSAHSVRWHSLNPSLV